MARKKITFSVPDWLYEHLQGFINIKFPSYCIDDLFKACAINRMIQIGYLDEFGQPVPIPFFEPNSLKLPSWNEINKTFDNNTFSISSLRDICVKNKEEKK